MRAVAPFLAGASGMRLRAFLPWSLLGTAAWAATFTLAGYAFHDSFSAAAEHLTHAAFAIALIAAGVFLWRARRRRAVCSGSLSGRRSAPQRFPEPRFRREATHSAKSGQSQTLLTDRQLQYSKLPKAHESVNRSQMA